MSYQSDLAAQAQAILYEDGLKMRTQVVGKEYVDKSVAGASDFFRPMLDHATSAAWGSIWTRPGLELKTRSLINLAMLTALNRGPELAVHTRGALNNGCSEVEIREVLMQAATYCGMPAGMEAFRVAGKVLDEYKAERGITGPVTGQSNKIATEDPTNLDIGVGERMNEEEV